MKAALALVVLYVATFFIVVSSSSQSAQQAKPQGSGAQSQPATIDPAKEADIRSLMELIGARDMIDEAASAAAEQYREKLLSTMPDKDKAHDFVNAFVDKFKTRYDAEDLADKIVTAYDKHYTADEIRGLLQFYGSPLGQRTAEETPKIMREIQADSREVSAQVAKQVLQEMKAQNPEIGQSARLGNGRRWQQRRQQQNAQVLPPPPATPPQQ